MTCKGVIIIAEISEVLGREVLEKCNLLKMQFSLCQFYSASRKGASAMTAGMSWF